MEAIVAGRELVRYLLYGWFIDPIFGSPYDNAVKKNNNNKIKNKDDDEDRQIK